jgi:aspartate carbamoyltransferase regulatory subunit
VRQPNCITNKNEPVEPQFTVESKDPVVLRCFYCDRIQEDFADRLV